MCRRAVLLILALMMPVVAKPYGTDGHESIALLADQILADKYPVAHTRVLALLGKMNNQPLSLRLASIWADCLRAYESDHNGNVHYLPEGLESPDCAVYHGQPADEAFSLNYVKEHNTNCEYSHKLEGCHKSFHFADIPLQSDTYHDAVVGKNDHDIVHALDACVRILQGKAVATPFTHIDKRAALLLLVHLMGDLHQPLHVGAVYLRPNGKPDPAPKDEAAAEPEATAGGNFILVGKDNLHHLWDETDYRKHATVLVALKQDALKKLADLTMLKPGSLKLALIETWADETLDHAAQAYDGLKFANAGNQRWKLSYVGGKKGKAAYDVRKTDLHKREVALASARLAWLLQELFK